MKESVFISWSGSRSKAVAKALYDWLPKIIQAVEPWMSESDIAKGTRWLSEIVDRLNEARFGLICLTPDNLDAPWILFEAGVLSKAVEKADTFVWTYLFDVAHKDIEWPLAQFQHTRAEKEDTRRLAQTINQAVGGALRENQLNELFDALWPELEQRLRDIPPVQEKPESQRPDKEILAEIFDMGIRKTIERIERNKEKFKQCAPQAYRELFDIQDELETISKRFLAMSKIK